ncbi:hypothetical protein [Paraflavitalea speifideaquila]|uniref:hypothetical protein n=1 Tax=Paraflavitalea speifideaquila TaxID=3076558 RepID=UPI0028EE9A9B|nr:hypothetical protein [Paraflavitalea speifideiaquila]
MKKLFAILAFSFVMVLSTVAQSTTPRFGITPNNDNTGRSLTYKFAAKTDATGNDTFKIVPNAYKTIYRVTLTDSLGFNVTSTLNCYAGDQIQIIASGASGTKVTFKGSNWISAGTATLSSGLRAVLNLVFDGSKWVEVSRVVQ